jgi:hypothetical protein
MEPNIRRESIDLPKSQVMIIKIVAESGAKESQISKYMEPDCMASPIVNQ